MSPALFFLLLGLAFIGIELIIMQFSVFWFLFFGLGAFIASGVAWFMPEFSWTVSFAVFLVACIMISVALYSPLKKWQNKPSLIAGNDAVGQTVTVTEPITADKSGTVSWSGSDWTAELDEGEATLEVDATAKIRKLKGIRLIVGR